MPQLIYQLQANGKWVRKRETAYKKYIVFFRTERLITTFITYNV